MSTAGLRVLVVDDQTLIRQGIRALLEFAGIEVISEAADGAEALRACVDHTPDVVLLDLRMPVYDGLWFLRKQAEQGIEAPALVLTTFDDDTLVLDAMRAGAKGYLLKDVSFDQLTRAVESIASGGTLISPSITDRLIKAIRSGPPPTGAAADVVEGLTDREIRVLRLVAEGYPNQQIAQLLHLANSTVKNHISSILAKLGARDRTNAVLRAIREGILG